MCGSRGCSNNPPPYRPPGGCTGSCPVPITASCSPLPVSGATPQSVTFSISSQPSGGAGSPYTYKWGNYVGTIGGTGSSQAYTLTSSYSPSLVVTDESGQSATIYCAQFTATNNTSNTVELWSGTTKPTGSGPSGSIEPTDSFTYHIRSGSNIALNYDWPTSQFPANNSECVGYILPLPNVDVSAWTGGLSLTNTPQGPIGSTLLSNLPTGIYTVQIKCLDPAPTFTYTPSNIIKINVTPSTPREQ